MNVPIIYEDECWLGFVGRTMLFNNISNPEAFVRLASQKHAEQQSISEIALSESNLSTLDFLCNHTHFAYRHIIDSHLNQKHRYLTKGLRLKNRINQLNLRTPSPLLCYCPQCIQEDIDLLGISYWRREHQFLGSVICTRHMCELRYITNKYRIIVPPPFSDHTARCFDSKIIKEALQSPMIIRYHQLSKLLMQIRCPLPTGLEENLLTQARNNSTTKKLLEANGHINELVIALAGDHWITKFFARVHMPRNRLPYNLAISELLKVQWIVDTPTFAIAIASLREICGDSFTTSSSLDSMY